jgi:hypothetical protein
MENSSSYVALKAMLKQGWVLMSFAELERVLYLLEEKELMSADEHKLLAVLAKHFGIEERCDGEAPSQKLF